MKKIGDQPGRDEIGATGGRASRTNGLVLVGRKGLFSSKMREKEKNDGCGKKRRKNLSYLKRSITDFWVLKSFLVMYLKAYVFWIFFSCILLWVPNTRPFFKCLS